MTAARSDLMALADEFDEIEVDEHGKCDWTAVANAQTHLRAQLRLAASQPDREAVKTEIMFILHLGFYKYYQDFFKNKKKHRGDFLATRGSENWNKNQYLADAILSLLSGAITKSDGGQPSIRTAGGFPVAAAPSQAEETGAISGARQDPQHGTPHGSGVTGGESAAPSVPGPSDPSPPAPSELQIAGHLQPREEPSVNKCHSAHSAPQTFPPPPAPSVREAHFLSQEFRKEIACMISPDSWQIDNDGYLVEQIGAQGALDTAEITLLQMCADAGVCGAVIPNDEKVAMTLAGMHLIQEVQAGAFSITAAGAAKLSKTPSSDVISPSAILSESPPQRADRE